MSAGALALLRPWWLVALPLAAFLYWRLQAGGAAGWRRAVDPPLLAAMVERGMAVGGRPPGLNALIGAIVLIALGLSGPAIKRIDADRFRNLDATLIVLDGSAEATQGAALRQATTAARLVLESAAGRQTGLIVYAADAYVAGALTDDAAATTALIFALDDQTLPDPGARPERALALARSLLRDAGVASADIALVSAGDGVGDAALREAKALAGEGHHLHTVFAPPALRSDPPEPARRAALAALAAAGDGIGADAARPDPVLDALAGRSIRRLVASSVNALYWRDYGRILLALAALPLFFVLRRAWR